MSTITIKIKPYLKEFIKSRLEDSLNSSFKNIVGAVIVPFIESVPKGTTLTHDQGDEYLEIPLMQLNSKFQTDIRANKYISPRNQENIERILNAHFEDLFFQYVDDKKRYDLLIDGKRFNKGQLKLIISQFCAENNIPLNHITYEMLKKKYYRKQIKVKGPLLNLSRHRLIFLI